ncbi:MAG TPA: hypothetical protein VHZ03_26740 [Trebonia sp.]|nr:hypothetical protein [Trebonia sp.]
MTPTAHQKAVWNATEQPELLRLCEHNDILDKVVLWDDPAGFRVRLHVFLPGYFDGPHNHRWSYASTILAGEYRRILFGGADLDERVDPASLTPVMVRWEQAGTSYLLQHTMVHAVVAEPYTVSLVIRGAAVKDRFSSWTGVPARAGGSTGQAGNPQRMPPRSGCPSSGWLS